MNDILTISEHQEILVSSKRDVQNNIISYEDRELLFDIKYTDKKDKERYIISNNGKNKIKANSIVGSISLKTGLTVEILPKFAKNDLDEEAIKKHRKMLLNILRVSNEQNFISSSSQSSKVLADEMPLLHYVIELFSAELLHTLRTGVYATYNKKVENSSHIRGNILISKSIQNNIIDKSKVYISYNKHSSNNLLMQVFRTLVKILLNDNNLSYKAKQMLHEVYLLLDGIDIIPLKQQDFKSITFNRLNDKFEILFRQAEFIFNRYMPFSSHINSTPFWAILFDMNYLFEKFCAYLFRRSGLEVEEQNMTKCFDNHKSIVSAKPDFVIKGNRNLFDTEIISVVDAKWKLLSNDKSLYGLDAQNFLQLFSYMNLLNHNKALHGYFIVPKNSKDFEDEIIFTPIKEGNKSITILSIDFSLSFEELIEKYRFCLIDNELKLKITTDEEENTDFKSEIINLENDLVRFKENQIQNKKYIDNLTQDKFIIDYAHFSSLISQVSDKNFKYDKQLLKDFCKLSKTKIKKVFDIMRENEDDAIDVDLLFETLSDTLDTSFYKKALKEKQKDKSWKNRFQLNKPDSEDHSLLNKNDSFDETKDVEIENDFINDIKIQEIETTEIQEVITEEPVVFNNKEVEKYYTNDYETLISLANIKNLPDEYKIILFYCEYDDIKIRNDVRDILKSNSNHEIIQLFETSIRDIVNLLDNDFETTFKKNQSWIRGFVYCDNNQILFKIKVIIAKNCNNNELIEKLSDEQKEKKILFSLLNNFQKNEKSDYVVSSDILKKIFINTIDKFECDLIIAILRRRELEFSLFKEMIERCQGKINLQKLKDNLYFDKNISNYIIENLIPIEVIEEINPYDFENITIEKYQGMDEDSKIKFISSYDLKLLEPDFINYIITHESIDILDELTYADSLPLKYLVLTYTYHTRSTQIQDNIKKRDNKISEICSSLTHYIDNHFTGIDKEVLLGISMSQNVEFNSAREAISIKTYDVDVLNELSKHRDNDKVLKNIIFKTKINHNEAEDTIKNKKAFIELVKNKNTIYSLEILDRIAHYAESYEFENSFCIITQLAGNYSLTEETKEYLFEKYKNDMVFLEALSKNNSPWELQNKIKSALSLYGSYSEIKNDEVFNGINLKIKT